MPRYTELLASEASSPRLRCFLSGLMAMGLSLTTWHMSVLIVNLEEGRALTHPEQQPTFPGPFVAGAC